jgi:site-specific DNA-cytosine methylase
MKWISTVPLIGGFTLGAKKAYGNDPEYILSYKPFAKNDQHIRNYFPNVPYKVVEDGYEDLDRSNIDVVNTLCPCAGLSQFNSGNRGADAPQNDWMYKTAELMLEKWKPKVMIGENAPGLFTKTGAPVADKLYKIAEDNGYSMSLIKTNTKYHGIPQNRPRSFYFFWKSDTAPVIEKWIPNTPTLENYLDQIPAWASQQTEWINKKLNSSDSLIQYHLKENRELPNSTTALIDFYEDKMDDIIQYMYQAGDEQYLKRAEFAKMKLDMGKNFWSFGPFVMKGQINTLYAVALNNGYLIEKGRGLSVRDAMHLMGIPHDFVFDGLDYNHICQNVPTCTAEFMSIQAKKFVNGEMELSNEKFLRQDLTKLVA